MEELVIIQDSQALTTSRKIAEKFSKNHKEVLRAINLLECSSEFSQRNFAPISYTDTYNREQKEYAITRDGFVFLVMGFTGREAAKFKEEFINAFNKIEAHLKALLQPTDDAIILKAITTLQARVETQSKQLELANQTIQEQAPKVKYTEEVLNSDSLITVNAIAKELGMSAISLNHKLQEMKIQYRQSGLWLLYAQYQNKGYTKTKTYTYYDSSGKQQTSMQTYWTEAGRAFIHSKVNQVFNLPRPHSFGERQASQ